jgi:hypothetical protein
VKVPPTFFLEWFLKSLVPYVSKDIMTSIVFPEEEAIMVSQQLEFIYSIWYVVRDPFGCITVEFRQEKI